MRAVRLNESSLRKVIRKIIAEQPMPPPVETEMGAMHPTEISDALYDEAEYFDTLMERTPDRKAEIRKSANNIKKLVGGDNPAGLALARQAFVEVVGERIADIRINDLKNVWGGFEEFAPRVAPRRRGIPV